MSFFGKNIKKIRGVKGLSQQAFSEVFGLKRATLGAYEEGRSEPKVDTIIKIANYFSIPIDDLLKVELTVNQLLQFKEGLTEELDGNLKEQFAIVPCITEKDTTNYIQFFEKKTFIKNLPVLQLPINTKKDFRAYVIANLEMTHYGEGLYPKDIVIGERVPKDVYKKLNNALVLVLVQDKLVLRRLYIAQNDVVLRADHKSIDDFSYKISEIKELWRIRYVFFKRLPEFNNNRLEEKMSFLEEEIIKLKGKL